MLISNLPRDPQIKLIAVSLQFHQSKLLLVISSESLLDSEHILFSFEQFRFIQATSYLLIVDIFQLVGDRICILNIVDFEDRLYPIRRVSFVKHVSFVVADAYFVTN